MPTNQVGRRTELLQAGAEFVRSAIQIPGVVSLSLVGSICTERQNPKDIDFSSLSPTPLTLRRSPLTVAD